MYPFKRIIYFLLLVCVAYVANTQTTVSLLTGEITGLRHAKITLFRNANDVFQKNQECNLSASNNHFAFAIPAKGSGEFLKLMITEFEREGTKAKDNINYQLYLYIREGQSQEVAIKLKAGTEQVSLPDFIVKGPSAENELLKKWQQQWYQFHKPIKGKTTKGVQENFAFHYRDQYAKAEAFIKALSCKSNPAFEQIIKEYALANLRFLPIDYYMGHSNEIKEEKVLPLYQQQLKASFSQLKQYCGSAYLQVDGITNIRKYYNALYEHLNAQATDAKPGAASKEEAVKALVCNEQIRSRLQAGSPSLALQHDATVFNMQQAMAKQKHLAWIQVSVQGFKNKSDFSVIGLEELTNETLMANTSASSSFLLPIKLSGPTLLNFEVYDLKGRLYLKPGELVKLVVYNLHEATPNQRPSARYAVAEGSEANRKLCSWNEFVQPLTRFMASGFPRNLVKETEQEFIAKHQSMQQALPQFINDSLQTADQMFNLLMKSVIEFDMNLSPLFLIAYKNDPSSFMYPTFRGFSPGKVPEYFRQFGNSKILCNPDYYKFPDAGLLVHLNTQMRWAITPASEKNKIPAGNQINYQLRQLYRDEAKAIFLSYQINGYAVTNWHEFKKNIEPNKQYFVTRELKNSYKRLQEDYAIDTQFIGKPVTSMHFSDTSGKKISLANFKGKVVFIDVWATWCAPCKEQLPYLKQLEEEYKDNNEIIFVGLSVDREKDREKWKEFIQNEKLPGIQLIDYSGLRFGQPYKISAIPRFILIDKQGKIYEMRCPYPENASNLISYINNLL